MEEAPVTISAGTVQLDGDLAVPERASGVVVFAHGSGSSRKSPRNRHVAQVLQEAGLGTLLFDLLTPDEEQEDLRTRELRFDIELLARRLVEATQWLTAQPETQALKIGYFGASTGAAAALIAASRLPDLVSAVVSRGGCPDLAGDALEYVQCPVLLIVGGADTQVLAINRQAAERIPSEIEIFIVPGAGHLFEESGALEQVAVRSADFLRGHLDPTP